MGVRPLVGKVLYAGLFILVAPIGLLLWAIATRDAIPLPTTPYPWGGWIVAGLGGVLLLVGMWTLWVRGKGLPMNAYPPPVYVTTGVFRYVSHPIYIGFVTLCVGVAILTESPSGLWLLSPTVALACAALVLGHERHDLGRRFGEATLRRPLLALPPASEAPPTGWDRASVFLLVLVPWSAVFEAVYRLGIPPDAVEAYLPFERAWPVLAWTEAVYGSVYLFVLGSLFVAASQAALRWFAILGLIATGVVTLIYLTVPVVAPPRPFEPQTLLGRALMGERAMSHTVAAFPAFHVIWSLIAAETWASRSRRVAVFAWAWAILITISCVTTGMHALADLAAAVVVFLLLRRYRSIWEGVRRLAERVADSWREWRVGHVRVIVHGAYAALGGTVGLAIALMLAGPGALWPLVFAYWAGLLGAALFAQTLEGSPKLSRPFGYYGSAVGGIAGALVAGAVAGNTMLLLAAIALAAPWNQAIGRLRCLVQGCCHGSPAPVAVGIRYWQPRSRVLTLGHLGGVPLHPTPLYSILSNAVIGVLLLRFWSLGAQLSLIAGLYLILAGITRFVEESYRGEPQTLVVGGLRIYQWFAMASLVAGIAITTLPSAPAPGLTLWLDVRVLAAALVFGLGAGFAMGVDFPGSTRRFARLAEP